MKPIDYKQSDSKWGALSYAVDGESSTIKSAGCGPTAMASVLAALVSPYIDPITTASWARQHGYKVYKSGTSYSFPEAIGKEYGLEVKRINTVNAYGKVSDGSHEKAKRALIEGKWVLACMGPGNWTKSGHYILVYNFNQADETVDIMDPASAAAARVHNKFSLLKSQAKYYWEITIPDVCKKNGTTMYGTYLHRDFVREVQLCCKAGLDGIAGAQTLSKTVTVSKFTNRKHPVVVPLQKKLLCLGFYSGRIDGIAGDKFDAALKEYQTLCVKLKVADGEATKGGKTWKNLLKLNN